ncbi:MAG: diaminopropionate ammonia-lyase [Pseudomonadales bacterium]|jgi:diaminopropionate ammonia-lyase|nr:diaminopropionate ammonia-lyase [Pseudomonadales bacterium]
MEPLLRHFRAAPSHGDAANRVLTAQYFAAARAEITCWDGYAPTPLHALGSTARELDLAAVHYKDEGPRFGLGSFKALGGAWAAQRVLQRQLAEHLGHAVSLDDVRARRFPTAVAAITLVAATDGNHGRALAWGCERFGARCRIYVHAHVSEKRAAAMRAFGADVVRIEGDYDASVALAREEAAANGWTVVSDTSWPGYTEIPRDVMAGYGVMIREVHDVLAAAPTHLFVQGGVGGLAAAAAAASRQLWGAVAPRLVVVEPALAPCLFASARAGRPTPVAIEAETIMAGLSCGEPSPLAWEILASEASDFLLVDDALIPPTVRRLAEPAAADPRIEAGESGVAGLAALVAAACDPALREALGLDATARVLLIGSEGVTDPEIFADILGSL